MRSTPHPVSVYLVLKAATALLFYTSFTIAAIYRIRMADLNPLQLVLVGTVLEAAVFLFEIPTGVIADTYSRRLSIILGCVVMGAGFLLEGALPVFATILLAQAIWGAGYTLISGAEDAWLADEIGEDRLQAVYLRGAQAEQVASLVGVVACVALASWRLNLPLLFTGVGFLALAIYLSFAMPETGFAPTPAKDRASWRNLSQTFTSGLESIRGRSLLMRAMGITLFAGVASEGIDRLWEAHLLAGFTFPALGGQDVVVWFGLINAGAMLATLAVTEIVKRRVAGTGQRFAVTLLTAQNVLLILGLLAFGLTRSFAVAIAAYGAIYVLRHAGRPIFMAWINRGIEPQVRATVLSTINQMDAIGQVAGGPGIGAIANRWGLRTTMVVVAALLAPVVGLYSKARRD